MQKPRIPPRPTTKTRNIVFSLDGVSCAEKDENKKKEMQKCEILSSRISGILKM